MLINNEGEVVYINKVLYSISKKTVLVRGLEVLEGLMDKDDRHLFATEIDSVWSGMGNERYWTSSLKIPELGLVTVTMRSWLLSPQLIVLELNDISATMAAYREIVQSERELSITTKLAQLRTKYVSEDAFYHAVLKIICNETQADGALLYFKPTKQPGQLVAGVSADNRIFNIDLTTIISRLTSHRVELQRKQILQWQSLLSVPLHNQEGPLGWLILLGAEPDNFDWTSIRLVTKVGQFLNHLVNLDIMRRQREHSENIALTIFSNVQDGLIVVNDSGIVININPPAAAQLQIAPGRKKVLLQNLVIPGYQATINRFWQRLQTSGKAKCRVRLKGDNQKIYEIEGVRIATEQELVYLGNIKDVSEWVNRQELLQQKTRRLEQIDRLKDQFISMVSHELRSPLTVIKGHLSLWQKNSRSIDQSSMEAVAQGTDRLDRFVGDILLAAQMEYGELPLVYSQIDLPLNFANLVNQLKPLIEEKELKLKVKIAPLSIETDVDRLNQALVNILMNAIKYCNIGDSIKINVRRNQRGVTITIADTGPGIAQNQPGHIFDRFFKGNNSSVGAGLGLFITHQIVKRMGGQISVKTKLGQGTKFRVSLPVKVY